MPPRVVWSYEVSQQTIASYRGDVRDLFSMVPPVPVYARTPGGRIYRADPPWSVMDVGKTGSHTDPLRQVERVRLVSHALKPLKVGGKEHRKAALLFVHPEGTALPKEVGHLMTGSITQAERCAGGLHADWVTGSDLKVRCAACGIEVKDAFRRVPYPVAPSRLREVEQRVRSLDQQVVQKPVRLGNSLLNVRRILAHSEYERLARDLAALRDIRAAAR